MLPLALAALLLAGPPTSQGQVSKKERELADKAAQHDARPPRAMKPGKRATRPVYARNLRTHEIAVLTGPGRIREQGIDRFFKCWFTLEHGDVPDSLVRRILAAAGEFDAREVRIISGFRHPKYNLSLVKKGREVARRSKHMEASAIDFFFPQVETRALYDYLLRNHDGGVGFYPISQFVHIDTGRKRTWKGT